MKTWVLILWLNGSGKAIATVPGYPTEQDCTAAAVMIQKDVNARCIPGPTLSK